MKEVGCNIKQLKFKEILVMFHGNHKTVAILQINPFQKSKTTLRGKTITPRRLVIF